VDGDWDGVLYLVLIPQFEISSTRSMEIEPRYGPGLPKTPDPDQNLTGLFRGFLAAVSRIIAIIAPFALKGCLRGLKPACLNLFQSAITLPGI